MTPYSYYCSTQIEVGSGRSKELPEILTSHKIGKSILLVSDPGVVQAGLVAPIQKTLEASGYLVSLLDSAA